LIGRIAGAYRQAFAGLPAPVWSLALVAFVNRSGTMVVPFLILYLTEARGYSATAAGRFLGLYGLGSLAGSFLGGWLSDHIPPRRVLLLSLSFGGIVFLVLGPLRSGAAIAVALLALSTITDAFRPALATAVAESTAPGERSRAFVLSRLAVNLGMSVGPVAGGFLALHGYIWLFVVDGTTALLAAGVLALAFRGEPPKPVPHGKTRNQGSSPWKDRPFLALAFLMTLYGLVFFQLLGAFPLTLRDRFGMAENWIGMSLSVNTLLIVLFEMLLVHSLRRVNPYRVLAWGSLLMCLGFALLPLGSGRAFVVFTVVVWTLGEMLSLSIVSGLVAERAGERSQGRYMGVFSLAFSVAFVLAPLGGTWIYQRFSPETLWYGCFAIGVVLWAGFNLLSGHAAREAAGAPATG
jgi:MFS family permease